MKELNKNERIILYLILAFYCAIIWFIVIDRGLLLAIFNDSILGDPRTYPRTYNLIPFKLIRQQYGKWGVVGITDMNVFGNFLMFIPIGIFTCVFTKNRNPYCHIYFIPIISIVVEIIQYILATGSFDVDDIILNTLGGLTGILLFAIIYKILQKDKTKTVKVIIVLASIMPPYLLIFFYKLFIDISQVRLKWYDMLVVLIYYMFLILFYKDNPKKQRLWLSVLYAVFFVVFFSVIIFIQ